MKREILEDLATGHGGSKLRRLIFYRIIKFITVCVILILLFWLVLVEDYTSLFFLLGGISGFLVFWVSRLLQNNLRKEKLKESPEAKSESMKLPDLNRVERNPAAEK